MRTAMQRTDNIVLVSGAIESGDMIVFEGADRVPQGVPLPAGKQQMHLESGSSSNAAGPGSSGGNE